MFESLETWNVKHIPSPPPRYFNFLRLTIVETMSSPDPSTHSETNPIPMSTQPPNINKGALGASLTVIALVGIWILAGIVAVIMSIVCFGFSGTTAEKIVGVFIAFFLGPLYFIFYGVNKGYCRNLGANVIQTVGTVGTVGGRK